MANPTAPITSRNIPTHERPAQDEWGIFDPKQAGVEAVLRKLHAPASDKDERLAPAKK